MAAERMDFVALETGVIHVWAARLDHPSREVAQLEGVLSTDEQKQASRFVFPRDRKAYTASRGTLRHILAGYVGIPPEALTFEYNQYGKPFLHPNCGGVDLGFNVAHSGSLALYAIRMDGEIGVDVEEMRPLADLRAIAMNTFSVAENHDLKSLPEHQYKEGFYACWTRKEAFIKAVGQGLSYPLQDFDVTLKPGEPARLRRIAGHSPDEWSLIDLQPAAGYAAAVAVPAPNVRVQWGWWDSTNLAISGQNSQFKRLKSGNQSTNTRV